MHPLALLLALAFQTPAAQPAVVWTPLNATAANGASTLVGYVPSCPTGYNVWTTAPQVAPPPGPPQVQSSMPPPTRIGRTASIKVDVARIYQTPDATLICGSGS